jgi:hypothetical protein
MRTTSDFTPKQKSADALLTRLESAEYISKELGRPLSFSTLQKLCAWGEGPTVAAWWGRRPLYSRNNLHAWVDARSRPKKKHCRLTNTGCAQRHCRSNLSDRR